MKPPGSDSASPAPAPTPTPTPKPAPVAPAKSIRQLALEVIDGRWGTGADRKRRLGASYRAVQNEVNKILNVDKRVPSRKTVGQLADEVIGGHWGNGNTRYQRLKAAWYDAKAVQAAVNKKLGVGGGSSKPKSSRKTAYQVAQDIVAGRGNWGNGRTRQRRLKKAGYSYNAVQSYVNRLMR